MMTARNPFGRVVAFALLAFAVPSAAGAQTVPESPQNVLGALTKSYFAAVDAADGQALAAGTSSTFHVVLPGGKRLSAGEFIGRLSYHHLNASTPIGTVKIGPVTIAGTTATETVETSSWNYLQISYRGGPVVEHDYATHQLSWIKSADGTWLLDEDRLTSSVHSPDIRGY